MVSHKAVKRWNWMAMAVFAMGVLSIAILIWIGRLSQSLNTSFDYCDALMDIRIKTASSHLWLEEAISEDSSVDVEKAFDEMDRAISLAEAILKGGKSEHGTPLGPLKAVNLRQEAEDIYATLIQFKTIALQRVRDPGVAQIGSLLDERFDAVYEDSQGKARSLEFFLERNLIRSQTRSEALFWTVLIVWTGIVIGATTALWGLEVRRKAAEENLTGANIKLQSRTEELRKHQERLRELVAERTAELTAANQTLQQEIVERRQIEAFLRESENKFRTLVENLPQEIYLKDKNSIYVYSNDNYARSLGIGADQIVGKTDCDLFPSGEAAGEIAEDKQILTCGKTQEIIERRARNGQPVVVQKFKVPIKNERAGAGGVLGIVWDITEKVRLESIAEAANTMENIGYVFSGIRHEIGNPISSIKMSLSVLAKKVATCPREIIKEYIAWMTSEISRVEYLLKALKNFNMYETPELENVHLDTFMDRFFSLVGEDLARKGVRIEGRIHPDVGLGLVDPRALQQVMLNIISNAGDALQGRENPQIEIEVLKSDGFITIKARDNGRGMSAEQQSEIFKPFRTTKPGGTGLGLVIAKKMLTGMKGTIAIESKLYQGSTVSISIPEGREASAHEHEDTPCY
jgi:PAS domain S-box-containing protein